MNTIGHWREEAFLPYNFYNNGCFVDGKNIHMFIPQKNYHGIYNTETGVLSEGTPFTYDNPTPTRAMVCKMGDKIYTMDADASNKLGIYDIASDTWTSVQTSGYLPERSFLFSYNGKLHMAYRMLGVMALNEATNKWEEVKLNSPNITIYTYFAGLQVGKDVYYAKGRARIKYDAETKYYTFLDRANFPDTANAALAYYNNEVYFVGGNAKRDIYAYNIENETWRLAGTLPVVGRDYSSAVFIGDRLYVIGGGNTVVEYGRGIISTDQFSGQPEEESKSINIVLTKASKAKICISSALDADTDYTWKSDDGSLAVMAEAGGAAVQGAAAAVLDVGVAKP